MQSGGLGLYRWPVGGVAMISVGPRPVLGTPGPTRRFDGLELRFGCP